MKTEDNTLVIRIGDQSIAIMDTGQDFIIRLDDYPDDDITLPDASSCIMLNILQMDKIAQFIEERHKMRDREEDAWDIKHSKFRLVNLSEPPKER